jgi:hypothetical protein
MEYIEVRGTLIYEKNLKLKISFQTPFIAGTNFVIRSSLPPLPRTESTAELILTRHCCHGIDA